MAEGQHRKKPTLGLALIAKNEEKNVEECISRCRGADQVSLVDTGSKDKTVELARACGAVVSEGEFNWPDPPDTTGIDFSAARNRSIDLLTTDWFMFLDLDERLDKGHIWNIKKAIETVDPKVGAILVTMYNEHGDFFWREKVMKMQPGLKFVGRVHEGFADETMWGEYAPNVKIHYEQRPNSERNYSILREEITANIDDMRLQYLMGREEFCWGNIPSAAYWLERYLRTYEKSGKSQPMRSADALFTLSMCHAKMNEFKVAKKYAGQCLTVNPDFKEAAQLLADIGAFENNGLAQQRWLEMAKSAQNRGLCFQKRSFQAAA
jgi:glycosyltransferase involved in cell wall biosynthesis